MLNKHKNILNKIHLHSTNPGFSICPFLTIKFERTNCPQTLSPARRDTHPSIDNKDQFDDQNVQAEADTPIVFSLVVYELTWSTWKIICIPTGLYILRMASISFS
jgi:hypothetical protein